MDTILWWLAQNAITVALLLPVVWLICYWLRLEPATQHWLWLALLVKLLLPPVIAWPVTLHEARAWLPKHSVEEPPAPFDQTGVAPVASLPPLESSATPIGFVDPVIATQTALGQHAPDASAAATAPADVHPAVKLPVMAGVALIWLGGSAVALLWLAGRLWLTHRLLLRTTPATSKLTAVATAAARAMGIKRVCVRISNDVAAPCVASLGRPVLLWPAELVDQAHTTLHGALVHELAHIARRDHIVLWLELCGSIVWWWNPVYWHIRRQLDESRELACDALALSPAADREQYAQILLELTTGQSLTWRPTPVCGVGAKSRRSLERRLKMLFEQRASGKPSLVGLLAVVALAAMLLPAWSLAQDDVKPEDPKAKPAPLTTEDPSDPAAPKIDITDDPKPTPGKPTANALAEKWKWQSGGAKAIQAEGSVVAVDREFIELSIGEKDGIAKGQTLHIVRGKPGEALGSAEVLAVRGSEALARVQKGLKVQVKDRVVLANLQSPLVFSPDTGKVLIGGNRTAGAQNSNRGISGKIGVIQSNNKEPSGKILSKTAIAEGEITIWALPDGSTALTIKNNKTGEERKIDLSRGSDALWPKQISGAAGNVGSNSKPAAANTYRRVREEASGTAAVDNELLRLEVELAELNLAEKKLALERVRKLLESKAVSQEELQLAEFAVRRAEIELRKAIARLDATQKPTAGSSSVQR
jgi:beta-lactamase regulating signal transducer with metallopeptidase domain